MGSVVEVVSQWDKMEGTPLQHETLWTSLNIMTNVHSNYNTITHCLFYHIRNEVSLHDREWPHLLSLAGYCDRSEGMTADSSIIHDTFSQYLLHSHCQDLE